MTAAICATSNVTAARCFGGSSLTAFQSSSSSPSGIVVTPVSVYSGYFGAGSGVMFLAAVLFYESRVPPANAMKNVLVPLITVIALSYAYLLEGSVLTETIFAWPGLGSYITDALFAADMPAVLGGTVVVGVAFVTLNMVSDIIYRLVDPRARA